MVDPFATLGLARAFDVDLRAIEKVHRELSRALHPDRYVGASASERRAALAKAIEVNEAFRVVRDPIRRADALLALILPAGAASGEESATKADPEFLMEMLEQREALSDAKEARDLEAVRRMASSIEERARGVERELSAGFAQLAPFVQDVQDRATSLASKIGELRYYRRFLDEVSAIEDELAA